MTKKHELLYPRGLGQGEVAIAETQALAVGQRNGKQMQRDCPGTHVLDIRGQMYYVSFYMFYMYTGMFLFLCVVACSFYNCMHFHHVCVNITHVYNGRFLCFSVTITVYVPSSL